MKGGARDEKINQSFVGYTKRPPYNCKLYGGQETIYIRRFRASECLVCKNIFINPFIFLNGNKPTPVVSYFSNNN